VIDLIFLSQSFSLASWEVLQPFILELSWFNLKMSDPYVVAVLLSSASAGICFATALLLEALLTYIQDVLQLWEGNIELYYYDFIFINNASLPLPDLMVNTDVTNAAATASGSFLKNISTVISEIKKPLYIYENFKLNKLNIYKDHKIKKSGIYCLINNINGHFYIGCSVNIKNRMSCYLSNSYLIYKKNSNQPIIKALLKYSQDNFSLIVIEHISNPIGPEGEKLLFDRESFWILKLCPFYNV
jgi:GIY-YIG catalytic domain